MTKVFQGKLTYVDAARVMDIPVPTVWKCFTTHWEVVSTEEGVRVQLKKAYEVGDFVKILKEHMQLFINRLEQAKELPVSSFNERAVTALSNECRSIMRDILEFEGKLKVGAIIQLSIVQIQMTKITSWLLTELCETDRQKLQIALPQIIQDAQQTA
jgi:hypothetical protein